jgi:NADH dehydrogenase
MAQLTAMVGIAPVLTRDQVTLLESDNVVADGAEGLAALGIEPTGIEAIAPSYLWRYRRGGQFAEAPAA